MNKRLTILICTFNRAELLQECLQSLVNQTLSAEHYEVLVINNNSTDETLKVAKKFVQNNSNFKVITELQQGLSYTRNLGFRSAKTEWIAYVDDDAKAHPNFVEQSLQTIENNNFDCFGGVYLRWFKYGEPKWFPITYGTNKYEMPLKLGILETEFACGGVFLAKKKVLEDLGGFATHVGMNGYKVAYGEETLIQVKMREHGYVIGFDPDLKIDHLVAKYKLDVNWYLKSAYAKGRDYWDTFDTNITFSEILTILFFWIPGFFVIRIIKRVPMLVEKDYYLQNLYLDIFSPIYLQVGKLRAGIRKRFFPSKPTAPELTAVESSQH